MRYNEKISVLLKTKGITRRQFADGIGLSLSNAQAIASGKVQEPNSKTKNAIAKFFSLSIEELFDDKIPLPSRRPKPDTPEATTRAEAYIQKLKDTLEIEHLKNIIAEKNKEIDRLNKIIHATFDAGFQIPNETHNGPTETLKESDAALRKHKATRKDKLVGKINLQFP